MSLWEKGWDLKFQNLMTGPVFLLVVGHLLIPSHPELK